MADEPSPLETEIRRLIAIAGPMPLAEYMRLCLTHPQHGYYISRDPIGAAGDFVTAPEISQMFGELIGLWMAAVWQQMGAPENVRIVELGPGRGTMMIDALRAAKTVTAVSHRDRAASGRDQPELQAEQQRRLQGLGEPVLWHPALDRRSRRARHHHRQRILRCAAGRIRRSNKPTAGTSASSRSRPDGKLAIGAARDPLPHFDATLPRGIAPGARRLDLSNGAPTPLRSSSGGACAPTAPRSIIDYGHARQGLGETLQAVAGHSYTEPLRAPGEADLTAHVDFEALANSAESIGGRIHGPVRRSATSCCASASKGAPPCSRRRRPPTRSPRSTARWRG